MVIAFGVTDADRVRLRLWEMALGLGPAGWDESFGHGLVDASTVVVF